MRTAVKWPDWTRYSHWDYAGIAAAVQKVRSSIESGPLADVHEFLLLTLSGHSLKSDMELG